MLFYTLKLESNREISILRENNQNPLNFKYQEILSEQKFNEGSGGHFNQFRFLFNPSYMLVFEASKPE